MRLFAKHEEEPNGVAVIVKGGAGTGKTILAVYLMKLFADINRRADEKLTEDKYMDEDGETLGAAESLKSIKKIGIVFPQATLKASIKDVFNSVKGLDAGMVFAIEFTQGFIAAFHKVAEIEFTPKVAEAIVQNFVAYLCVFVAGH